MHRKLGISFLLLMLFFAGILLGCGETRSHSRYPSRTEERRTAQPSKLPPPGAFNVRLRIGGWHVQDHRILDYDATWGYFRVAGRFDYLGTLVLKVKSDKYPEHYWLITLPTVQEGDYEVRAVIYQEPALDLKPVAAPKRFSIAVSIKDGKVTHHLIQNPHPGWGNFIVEKYRSGILYLRNDFYPGCMWKVKMPRNDGKWTIYPVLTKECSDPQ